MSETKQSSAAILFCKRMKKALAAVLSPFIPLTLVLTLPTIVNSSPMENAPNIASEEQCCPLADLHFDQSKVAYSTNRENLRDMRINPIAPAANMRRVTRPGEQKDTERFVPWFYPDNELARAVAIRKAAYFENPERVLRVGNDPSIRNAAQQLLELQAHYLADHYPELYEIEEDIEYGGLITNKVAGDTYSLRPDEHDLHPLAISGLLGQEDICIVEQMSDGRQVMVAGFLATPTSWDLIDFIGKDMDEIHKDVGHYKEKLKSTVDRSLANLPEYPERQFARNNAFLGINPLLALVPEEAPTIDQNSITDASSQIVLRSEYETLTRLPSTEHYPDNSKYIIFTIEPRVYALATMKQERGEDLSCAIKTNEVLGRKAIVASKAIDYLSSNE